MDSAAVATKKFARTIPFALEASESFDIGSDTGTGVDDHDYQVPFRFTGKLERLVFRVGRQQIAEQDRKLTKERMVRMQD